MLTLRFIPYNELHWLSTYDRIKRIVELAKEEQILLIEGRIKKTEEAELIKKTMEEISDKFKGIEIAEIHPEHNKDARFFFKLKEEFINLILGDRAGFTVVGPASIVKEIKQNPNKIELLTKKR